MKYHISIHISPYEIDNYQTFIHQLRRNLNYIDDEIIFSPFLNLSEYFYDWRNSKLKSDYFVNRFNELNNIVKDECKLDSTVNFKDKILGAFSYKTMFLEQYQDKVDAFIWFDSDMIFPDNAIVSLIGAHKALEDKHCIITPQIHRLWDETWDVLVNEDYSNTPASHDNYFGFDGYKLFKNKDRDLGVVKNEQNFKFASGWCNLLSSDLFKDYIKFGGSTPYLSDEQLLQRALQSSGLLGTGERVLQAALPLYKSRDENLVDRLFGETVGGSPMVRNLITGGKSLGALGEGKTERALGQATKLIPGVGPITPVRNVINQFIHGKTIDPYPLVKERIDE